MKTLKEQICRSLETHKEHIIRIAQSIWENPETGYQENKTSELARTAFEKLGFTVEYPVAVTGFRAELDSRKPGMTLALLAELDGLCLPSHPKADPVTGAAHACGHHLQIATLIGAATALRESGAINSLCGKIVFIAVPSEELGADEFRLKLRESGKIKYLSGKQEMIRLGVFDDIDAALLVHAGDRIHYPESYNGFIVKNATFKGLASHAGLSPENGHNALYAASLALSAINALRETFRDEDSVRVHGIITSGGTAVNIIPDHVEVSIMVRARTIDAIKNSGEKVTRALKGGAMAMGCGVDIETIPGCMPLKSNKKLAEIYENNLRELKGNVVLENSGHRASSTDMGDLSRIMPVLPPYSAGTNAKFHCNDFDVTDWELGCIEPAKLMAMSAIDILGENLKISDDTLLSKDEFLNTLEFFAGREHFSGK